MDERRYQVFLSSTFRDLQHERASVVAALLQMDAFPAGMELFPAADHDAWTLIRGVIEASDYYILIIAGKYGSIDPESDLSYTEKEYELALELGKPVLAFLHGQPGKLAFDRSEEASDIRDRLEAFRKKVEGSKHVKYWSTAEDLASKVVLSLTAAKKTHPAVGWVRGDTMTSNESISELNDLRKQLDVAEKRLESARHQPPTGAEKVSGGEDRILVVAKWIIKADLVGQSRRAVYRGEVPVEMTWNTALWVLGPAFLDELDKPSIREVFERHLRGQIIDQAAKEVKATIAGAKKKWEGWASGEVTVSDGVFEDLLIQLRALGLVKYSDKKRSIKDTSTYLTLTPYGDAQLIQLRAHGRRDEPIQLGKVVELKPGPEEASIESA